MAARSRALGELVRAHPAEFDKLLTAELDAAGYERADRTPQPCGTNAGYYRHLAHGEDVCAPCRQARSDYVMSRGHKLYIDRGVCAYCGRFIATRLDGCVWTHQNLGVRCPGSGRAPRAEEGVTP